MMRRRLIVLWAAVMVWGIGIPALAASGCYNVKDYGAYGNGFSDDTAGIQSAIDAAYEGGGGLVELPFGKYVLKGSVNLRSGVHLRGDNGTTVRLKLTDAGTALKIEDARDVHISALAFENVDPSKAILEYSGVKNLLVEEISVTGTALAVSGTDLSSHVVFRRNRADSQGLALTALEVKNTEALQVSDQFFFGYEKNVVAEDADNGRIERNHFQGGEIEVSGARQFTIAANTISEGGIVVSAGQRVQIANNHIIDPAECGITLLDGCHHLAVRANVIRSNEDGKNLIVSQGELSDIEISANSITKEIGADGKSAGAGLAHMDFKGINGFTLSNNHLINMTAAVEIEGGTARIAQNTFLTENIAGSTFNTLHANVKGGVFSVTGNVFRNIAAQTVSTTGLLLLVNGGDIDVSRNTVRGYSTDLQMGGIVFQAYPKPVVTVSDNFFCSRTIRLTYAVASRTGMSFWGNRSGTGELLDLSKQENMTPPEGTITYSVPEQYAAKIYAGGQWKPFGEISNGKEPITVTISNGVIRAVADAEALEQGETLILAVYDRNMKLNRILVSEAWDGNGDPELSSSLNAAEDTGGWAKAFVWSDLTDLQPRFFRSRYIAEETLSINEYSK